MLDRHFSTVRGAKDREYKTVPHWNPIAAYLNTQNMDRVFNDSGIQGDHDRDSDKAEPDSLVPPSANSGKSAEKSAPPPATHV